jgi:hypothetical protein
MVSYVKTFVSAVDTNILNLGGTVHVIGQPLAVFDIVAIPLKVRIVQTRYAISVLTTRYRTFSHVFGVDAPCCFIFCDPTARLFVLVVFTKIEIVHERGRITVANQGWRRYTKTAIA